MSATLDPTELASTSSFSDSPAPSKSLVLVGGAWQYPATKDPYGVSIYLDILKRAGGVENAKIGIFTSASSSAESAKENGELYVQDFQDLYNLYLKDEYPNAKIDVEWIPFDIENCEEEEDNPDLVEKIKSYTGFIFGGGDQSLITECFFDEDPVTGTRTETPVFKALKQRYEEGAVVAGTSAGTTVQSSSPMITEGESYEAVLNGPTKLIGSPPFVRDLYYNPLGGLGFFNYGLLDTHFSDRGRQGRIIRLASDVGASTTFGVDQNTALIVTDADAPNVNLQVLGQGGVFISDLSAATTDRTSNYWAINGVKATYLTEGDQYDPLTKTATFTGKTPLSGQSDRLRTTDNVFSWKDPETGDWTDPLALTETATDLFKSKATTTTGLSYETKPVQYGVTLTETNDAQGYSGADSQGAEKVSFANLDMAISPVLAKRELLDLRSQTGEIEASFETSSDALFNNVVGFYRVQDDQGAVIDPLTGRALLPEDSGYTTAAIRQSEASGVSFGVKGTAPVVRLQGGALYAPFLIANGSVEQLLNGDANDDPSVFFSFIGANSFQSNHVKRLAPNQFGFEDVAGGGDLDYNDAVLQVNLQNV
jgi:cyanophycinase